MMEVVGTGPRGCPSVGGKEGGRCALNAGQQIIQQATVGLENSHSCIFMELAHNMETQDSSREEYVP